MRERALRLAGVLLAVVLLGLPVAAAAAPRTAPPSAGDGDGAPTAEELGLEVVTGFGGVDGGGPWVPIEVRVQPRRPVGGTIAVEVQGESGPVVEARDLEVSPGSAKVFRFLVPRGAARVVVREPGRDALGVRAVGGGGRPPFVVGVLGEVPTGAPPPRLPMLGAAGQWVPVDPAWVEQSALALHAVDALVADAGDLAALPPIGRANVAAALVSGTDVVVAVTAPGPVDLGGLGLPTSPATQATSATVDRATGGPAQVIAVSPAPGAWSLRAADVLGSDSDAVLAATAAAGRGRLAVVGAMPGDGPVGQSPALWSELVGPSGRASSEHSEWSPERSPWQFSRLLQSPGGGAPALPWLSGFLVAYVVLVGPVNALVLSRMRRRELAWVTVPVVTAVFTSAAFLGATGGKPAAGMVATLTTWIDGVGYQHVAAGVRAPRPGVQELVVPGAGWTTRVLTEGGRPGEVRTTAEGAAARVDLASLQLGGVLATRWTDAPAPLAVEAVATPDGVSVTVTNTSSQPVAEVEVRAGTARTQLGDLAPGESGAVEVGGERLRTLPPFGDPLGEVMDRNGHAAPPRSLKAILLGGPMDGNPGLVWAHGTTAAAAVRGVRAAGLPAADRGGLVAVAVRPRVEGALSPYAVERSAPDVGGGGYRPSPLAVEGGNGEVLLRFRLPGGAAPPVLAGDLHRGEFHGGVLQLTAWDRVDQQWRPVEELLPAAGTAHVDRVAGPLGEVWVRATGDLFPFDFSGRAISGVPAGGAP